MLITDLTKSPGPPHPDSARDGFRRQEEATQGFDPSVSTSDYNAIPWRLGLLTMK